MKTTKCIWAHRSFFFIKWFWLLIELQTAAIKNNIVETKQNQSHWSDFCWPERSDLDQMCTSVPFKSNDFSSCCGVKETLSRVIGNCGSARLESTPRYTAIINYKHMAVVLRAELQRVSLVWVTVFRLSWVHCLCRPLCRWEWWIGRGIKNEQSISGHLFRHWPDKT